MSSTLIEVFGHIVFSFTRSVTEHYNPEEPEFKAEYFGYSPLESTGREWYYHPVDELIYQEYSDREAINLDYLVSSNLELRVINASSPEENEETRGGEEDESQAMAWKRLRPSTLLTVCKSMYIGALISLLTAIFAGSVYTLISYFCYKTKHACRYYPRRLIPAEVQWLRTDFRCNIRCFSLFLVLCDYTISFSPISAKGVEKETNPGVRRYLLFGCTLTYCCASSNKTLFHQ